MLFKFRMVGSPWEILVVGTYQDEFAIQTSAELLRVTNVFPLTLDVVILLSSIHHWVCWCQSLSMSGTGPVCSNILWLLQVLRFVLKRWLVPPLKCQRKNVMLCPTRFAGMKPCKTFISSCIIILYHVICPFPDCWNRCFHKVFVDPWSKTFAITRPDTFQFQSTNQFICIGAHINLRWTMQLRMNKVT